MDDLNAIQERLDKYNHPDVCNKSKLTEALAQDVGDLLAAARDTDVFRDKTESDLGVIDERLSRLDAIVRNVLKLAAAWEYNARSSDAPSERAVYKRCALRLREVLGGGTP